MNIIVNLRDGTRAYLRDYPVLRYEDGHVMATFTRYRHTRRAHLALNLPELDAEDWVCDAHNKPQACKHQGVSYFEVVT